MARLRQCMQLLAFEAASLAARRTPTERGRWRLAQFAAKAARQLTSPRGERRLRTRHGFRMAVNLSDWLGRHLYAVGEYEAATTHVIAALAEPGATVIDVGANAGYFTMLASQRVGSTGQVYAFEPVQINRLRVQENMLLNRTQNVILRSEAASSRKGVTTFFTGPVDHRGLSSLRPLSDASESFDVQTVRLDEVMPTDRRVSLVKIDVEGAEQHVLAGMLGIIRRDAPDVVLEVTNDFLQVMGHSAASLVGMMLAQGYVAYAIEHERLTPFNLSSIPGRQFNALFTQRDALPAELATLVRVERAAESSDRLRFAA